jgi:aspartyl/asparaginyl-tRNA synthetase
MRVGTVRETTYALLDAAITVRDWVRSVRDQKACVYVEVNDRSSLVVLQVVVIAASPSFPTVAALTTGCSVAAIGTIFESRERVRALNCTRTLCCPSVTQTASTLPPEEALLSRVPPLHRALAPAHKLDRSRSQSVEHPRRRDRQRLFERNFLFTRPGHYCVQQQGRQRHVPRHVGHSRRAARKEHAWDSSVRTRQQ